MRGSRVIYCSNCHKNPAFYPLELIVLPGDKFLCQKCKTVAELETIEAEAPDLYKALEEEDPSLIE